MIARAGNSVRYPPSGTLLLGKYRVEHLIGEGGMGAVVRALHLQLDEPVALKILLPDLLERPDIVRRFLREAKAAAKLKGEHVARVLDVGYLDGFFARRPYIVMEHLEGADLRAILKHHGAQPPAVAADLMLQACQAIAEAHSLDIIHRDIKTSNLFITRPDGQEPVLKVLDFGIASAPPGTNELTNTNSVMGTPAYMAPEQMRNARDANAKSDIWSLGVVLYEMLEGERPFRAEVYPQLCLAIGMDPPHPMRRAPAELRAVVYRCLEKSLERRYQTVAELAADLVPFASDPARGKAAANACTRWLARRKSSVLPAASERGEPISGTPAPLTPPSQLPLPDDMASRADAKPRGRRGVIAASFVIACAAGGGGWWWYETRESTPQPAAAADTSTPPAPIAEPPAAAPAPPTPAPPTPAPPTVVESPREPAVVAAPPEVVEAPREPAVVAAPPESATTRTTSKPPPRPVKYVKRAKPARPAKPKPEDDPFGHR